MARPSEYDRCECGNRKHRSSARCRRCYRRRQEIIREARKWALAAYLREPLFMILGDGRKKAT